MIQGRSLSVLASTTQTTARYETGSTDTRTNSLPISGIQQCVRGASINATSRGMTVSPELHERVLRRDGRCFLSRLSANHGCKDQWGYHHNSADLSKLTVDHVHDIPGGVRGKRAPDDERHMVAMCAKANIDGPSRKVREAEREYLQSLYNERPETFNISPPTRRLFPSMIVPLSEHSESFEIS